MFTLQSSFVINSLSFSAPVRQAATFSHLNNKRRYLDIVIPNDWTIDLPQTQTRLLWQVMNTSVHIQLPPVPPLYNVQCTSKAPLSYNLYLPNTRHSDASPPPLLRQSWVEEQYSARRPLYPPSEEKSIPRAIFQASHCSNDTSLRTQHMPKIPEQVVLSHAAQFAGHLVT